MSHAEVTLKSGTTVVFDCSFIEFQMKPVPRLRWEVPMDAARFPIFVETDEIAAVVFVSDPDE